TLDAGKPTTGTERFVASHPNGAGPWVFSDDSVSDWLITVRANHPTLGEISRKIAQGLVSGCDNAFYLERREKFIYSKLTGSTHEIELDLIHPLLKGSLHIRRWLFDESKLVALFPYQRNGNEFKLIDPDVMRKRFPKAWKYLGLCRSALEKRENGRFKGERFYQYSRHQNFEVMDQRKILVPAIAQRGEYAVDVEGKQYYVGSGGGGGGAHAILPHIKIDFQYLCGLLNSTCLDSFLQRVTTPFHSGWFAYRKAYIAQIPIKLPETPEEKKLSERIVESVQTIMKAKHKLRDDKLSDRERNACPPSRNDCRFWRINR
ncbi:MAG TPA: hypothetical protein VGY66_36240, partial [Gemmataceae bacterium]|nr:hypothetical protein [Gemmataceae bacterium]